MDKWFKSKWFVRILSLVLSVMLFTFVSTEESDRSQDENSIFFSSSSNELKTVEEMPVQIRINNEEYVVSGVPEHVDVSLEGKTSTLASLVRQRNFDVFVDLQDLGEGEHTVEIQYDQIPDDVSVYIEPKTIDVVIEEKATKEFPVAVDLINTSEMPDGFEVGTPVVEPSTVKITSSQSVIDEIALVKVFIDVNGLTEPIENREVPVNVYDGQGNELRAKIEPENVEVSVPVDNPSKSVPVNVSTTGSLPDGLTLKSIEPEENEVEIYGKQDLLDDIDDIQTEDIDLSDIDESGTIEVDLSLPEGVVASEDNKIGVIIELDESDSDSGESSANASSTSNSNSNSSSSTNSEQEDEEETTKTIDNIPIIVENGDDNQGVSFLEPASEVISLTVIGSDKDLDDLTADDFRAYIDVEGLEEGEHTVPVTVEPPDDIEIDGDVEDAVIEI